jgi:hypothetical protein
VDHLLPQQPGEREKQSCEEKGLMIRAFVSGSRFSVSIVWLLKAVTIAIRFANKLQDMTFVRKPINKGSCHFFILKHGKIPHSLKSCPVK